MKHLNTDKLIQHEISMRLAKIMYDGNLLDDIDRIPLEMRPHGAPTNRCCVYRDRAIIKYRVMALLGMSVEDEKSLEDELTPLSEYARRALSRENTKPPMITVLREACNGCVHTRYESTNACCGCLSQACVQTCPKGAVSMKNGRSFIDPNKCIKCGMCMKACPFHAIVYIPVPCEEACPTNALDKDDNGRVHINYDSCIFCGKCMKACPFSAIMERSQMINVIQAIQQGRKVVAMIAPAVIGQFEAELGQIAAAFKKLGFAATMEVAQGADKTAALEAKEFIERMEQGDRFMTSSCCPAYTQLVAKHLPELTPFVSGTRTPMHYSAETVKSDDPSAVTVFIGPCVAKRREALGDKYVDYVLTFFEAIAMFEAAGIAPEELAPEPLAREGKREGRSFPVTNGVTAGIKAVIGDKAEVKSTSINGLDKRSIKILKHYATKDCPANFVEVMGCEGGCVAGPAVVTPPTKATRKIQKFIDASPSGVE